MERSTRYYVNLTLIGCDEPCSGEIIESVPDVTATLVPIDENV